jgi:hypothetical protein
MSLSLVTNVLYDSVVNAGAYMVLQKTGIMDKVEDTVGEGELMSAIGTGIAFTLCQSLGDYFVRGRATYLQTGNLLELADNAAWNSIAIYGAQMLAVDDAVIAQTRKLPLPPAVAQVLPAGLMITGANVTRNLLDAWSATSGNHMVKNLTHPVYAASGALTFSADGSESQLFLLQ